MAVIEKREGTQGTRYRVKIRVKGRAPVTATFTRKTDAKRWAQATEAALRDGRHLRKLGLDGVDRSVGELIERYLSDVIPLKGSYGVRQAQCLAFWQEENGGIKLSELHPSMPASG